MRDKRTNRTDGFLISTWTISTIQLKLGYSVNKKGKDLKLISQSSTGKTCEKVTRKAIWPYIAKQLSSQSSFNCSNRTSAG